MSETTQLAVQAIDGFLKKQGDLTYLNEFDEAFRGREQRLPSQELHFYSPRYDGFHRSHPQKKRHLPS